MSFRTRLLTVFVISIFMLVSLPRVSEAVRTKLSTPTEAVRAPIATNASRNAPKPYSLLTLALATGTLWYNGDAAGTSALPNGLTFSHPDGRIFSDFNVTDANGWDVSAVFSNNLSNVTVTQASYEIRTGVSSGNPGVLLHSGTAPATQVATGRSLGGFTEYTVTVSGLSIHLAPGTYFLNVAPIGAGTGVSYNTATTGTNAVGSPPGNNSNEFWKSGANYAPTAPQGNDFSNGVIGNVTIPCTPPAITYVDDSWAGTPIGDDPDGAGPATYFGCDSFATIQGGVNGVATGGQVLVASGTYNEAQILILRAMTVTGAGSATTIINGGNAVLTAAGLVRIVTPVGDTGNVNFSGFTITNPGLSGETGGTHVTLYARPLNAASTVTVSDNLILGVNASDNGVYTIRNVGTVIYHHNVFTNQAFNPIVIERAEGPTDVHHNSISANGSTAYFNFTYAGTNVTTLQRVADNTVDGSTASAIAFNSAYPAAPPFTGIFTNISITNNTITQLAANRLGITLSNRAVSGSGPLGDIQNPVISGNIITGTDAVGSRGIRLSGLISNAAITSNDVRHLERSFAGDTFTDHSPTGTQAHFNNFVDNSGGFVWNGPETLNAENNWWGCNAGPGGTGCDSVTGLVDYDPWLLLGVTPVPSTVNVGGTSEVTADMTHNSDGTDTSASGTVPLVPVAFSATEGTMDPTSGTITAGEATSTFTSTSASSGTACATVDHQLFCADIAVVSPADISGTKTKSGGTEPDQSITYTVVLSNSSAYAQFDNPGAEFTDVLPSSLTLVSASATSGTAVATTGTNTVTWDGSLGPNSSVTITIDATINNVPNGTVVSNQGTISYDADGNGTNEASRVTDDPSVGGANDPTNFTVVSNPDLTITKTHEGNFTPGQVGATYTITVTNSGTGVTDGSTVTVTDTVPVGLTPTSPNGPHNGWSCSIVSQTLTCSRNDVLPGGSSYPAITLTVNVANPGPLTVTNTATVSGGGEPDTTNNSATDVTNIDCAPDASLNNTSPLVISRFRENGPGGVTDEFVEIFNPSDSAHTVATGSCTGGYGVFASAGNGTTSNEVALVCEIPNGTVIPARGYYLCTGTGYTLSQLGRNGGSSTAQGDAKIGCNGNCTADIPNDAGLALINVGTSTVVNTPTGFGAASVPAGSLIVFDKVGFSAYGAGAPASAYPSLAGNFCEGTCLRPIGDASNLPTCTNTTEQFPVVSVPPACYGQSGQYELLRRQTVFNPATGTLHQDTNANTADVLMVSPNPGINVGLNLSGVAGLKPVLGAASPHDSTAPADFPTTVLSRTPFDAGSQTGPRNAERLYSLDPTVANPENNPQGTYALRFKYTNNSPNPITGLRFSIDDLSTLCGPQNAAPETGTGEARNLSPTPNCQNGNTFAAILKLLNSTAEVVVDSTSTAQSVKGTVIEDLTGGEVVIGDFITLKPSRERSILIESAGPLSPLGGGIDNSLVVNPSTSSNSVGDGVNGGTGDFFTVIGTTEPNKHLRVKVKFGVVKNGRFIILMVPMGQTGSVPE